MTNTNFDNGKVDGYFIIRFSYKSLKSFLTFQNFYSSFQADASERNVEICGIASILFPWICSMVVGVLPWVENMDELAGQIAGLTGDAKSSMLQFFFPWRIGVLLSFLNFALLFLNQICKKTVAISVI